MTSDSEFQPRDGAVTAAAPSSAAHPDTSRLPRLRGSLKRARKALTGEGPGLQEFLHRPRKRLKKVPLNPNRKEGKNARRRDRRERRRPST